MPIPRFKTVFVRYHHRFAVVPGAPSGARHNAVRSRLDIGPERRGDVDPFVRTAVPPAKGRTDLSLERPKKSDFSRSIGQGMLARTRAWIRQCIWGDVDRSFSIRNKKIRIRSDIKRFIELIDLRNGVDLNAVCPGNSPDRLTGFYPVIDALLAVLFYVIVVRSDARDQEQRRDDH